MAGTVPPSGHGSPSPSVSPAPPAPPVLLVSPIPPLIEGALPQDQAAVDSRRCRRNTKRKPSNRTIIKRKEQNQPDQEEAPPSSEESDTGPQAKRSKQWINVSSVSHPDRPRDFLQDIAGSCDRLDLSDLINTLLASNPATMPDHGGTLKGLTSQWVKFTGQKNHAQFWQSAIEIMVFLKCQRYVQMVNGKEY